MTCDDVMARLQGMRNEMIYKHNAKNGAGDNQFGAKSGDIRALAKEIKANPELAKELWATGNLDARLLATLLMKPRQLSLADLDELVGSVTVAHVADWLSNVVKQHPDKESRREAWMASKHDFTVRMGWSLTTEKVLKDPASLDLAALLDRVEKEMPSASPVAQWTMNYCLAEIGIHHAEHRRRALAIGEKIGAFKDYPVSKGCTSPYAPIWIAEMVKRQG
ncbi:MAG: DNA alkylation repair protein [Armatimonadetes bacterium]|nr:DNA alkylation repair protein [Armatimonadota bacterium]